MKAKVGRMAIIVLVAVTLIFAAVPVAASDRAGSVAVTMSSVAQLCSGDGGGSGGG